MKNKAMKNYFNKVSNQVNVANISKYMDYYKDYKQFLLEYEKKEGLEPVNWMDGGQMKFAASYCFQDKEIAIQPFNYWYIPGVTYTTSENAIWEYIEKIGERNFKKYVLGVNNE